MGREPTALFVQSQRNGGKVAAKEEIFRGGAKALKMIIHEPIAGVRLPQQGLNQLKGRGAGA
jgi:hypothetical protein